MSQDFPESCVLKLRFIRDPMERKDMPPRPRAVRMRLALKHLLRACGIENMGYAADDTPLQPLPKEIDPEAH